MASTTTSTNSANERNAAATVRTTRGLLAIHGVQSWTVGNEQAWGRTPAEVGSIFYFLHFNFCIICFLHLFTFKKFKKIEYDKNNKNIYSTLICDLRMFSFSYVEMMNSCSIYNSSVPRM